MPTAVATRRTPPPADLAPRACLICQTEANLRSAQFRAPESIAREIGRRVIEIDLCDSCSAREDRDQYVGLCLLAESYQV